MNQDQYQYLRGNIWLSFLCTLPKHLSRWLAGQQRSDPSIKWQNKTTQILFKMFLFSFFLPQSFGMISTWLFWIITARREQKPTQMDVPNMIDSHKTETIKLRSSTNNHSWKKLLSANQFTNAETDTSCSEITEHHFIVKSQEAISSSLPSCAM